MELNGNIVVVSDKGTMVSNQSTIDIQMDLIETSEGRKSVHIPIAQIDNPFGELEKGTQVDVAWKCDTGETRSYSGEIIRYSADRCVIRLGDINNDYKETIRRAKEWLV